MRKNKFSPKSTEVSGPSFYVISCSIDVSARAETTLTNVINDAEQIKRRFRQRRAWGCRRAVKTHAVGKSRGKQQQRRWWWLWWRMWRKPPTSLLQHQAPRWWHWPWRRRAPKSEINQVSPPLSAVPATAAAAAVYTRLVYILQLARRGPRS